MDPKSAWFPSARRYQVNTWRFREARIWGQLPAPEHDHSARAERRIGHSAPSTYHGISCISFRCRPGHGLFRGLTRIWPADPRDAMLEQDGNFIECLRYPQIVWRANFV